MSTYQAPLKEFQFLLETVAPLAELSKLEHFADATPDTVRAILEESAKFARDVLDPLNWSGDREGSKRNADDSVTTPKGFKAAYDGYRAMGGAALPMPEEFGGLGLPRSVVTLTDEMLHSSNMGFGLMPMLTQGAIEAILLAGSDTLKATYLEKMVSGRWTGTMNLTEPQAGSDLALVKTRAVPQADGTYRVFGTKIYITYGEHDWAENIVHLVLARLPDAPEGVKGISLLVVPKMLVNADGSLGARNDVKCVSLEHKLGIHASPTAVMQYGDNGGAVGYIVGQENRGLEYMFIMMNLARFGVGLQGVGIAERSYQRAVSFARERVQSRDVAAPKEPSVPIIRHPDVRRMLLRMRSQTEAARALAMATAYAIDLSDAHPDEDTRKANKAFADLMIPIVKGWSTEMAQDVTYNGVQVHGGMGFVEETGAAQYYRDARITTIYEGTTAIQANDLIGRKMAREGGVTAKALIGTMRAFAASMGASHNVNLKSSQAKLIAGIDAVERAVEFNLSNFNSNVRACFAGSVPMVKLFGIVCGAWVLARVALEADRRIGTGHPDKAFYEAKIATLRFYTDTMMPEALAAADTIVNGADGTLALAEASF
ncbi:MAG: acyl-CoA dehydrogenase [Betaproteobacteria bacterium]|nr:MAG: acyl-CoA dehydrogenase [Betaproteobacteria bacterium]